MPNIASSLITSNATDKAANTAANAQTAAANMQLQLGRENRDIGLTLDAPFRQAGYTALAGLMDMAGLSRQNFGAAGVPAPTDPASIVNGYLPDGKTYIPAKPKEFLGDDKSWQKLYTTYIGDKEAFRSGKGKYYSNPSSVVGGTDEKGLYGRSGKSWGAIMEKLYGQTTGANAPFNTDKLGVPDLSGIPKFDFKTDPGYQFRIDEGMKALQNSAAARGGLLSGGFAQNAMQFGQSMASQEYGNVFNRLASISGIATTPNTTPGMNNQAQLGAGAAQNVAGAGASRASGYLQNGQTWANGINQGVNALAMMYGGGWFRAGAGMAAGAGGAGGSVPRV